MSSNANVVIFPALSYDVPGQRLTHPHNSRPWRERLAGTLIFNFTLNSLFSGYNSDVVERPPNGLAHLVIYSGQYTKLQAAWRLVANKLKPTMNYANMIEEKRLKARET
jgi:hypothetical protein